MPKVHSVMLFAFALYGATLFGQTTNYPGSLDTNTSLFSTADNVQTTLTQPMAIGDAVAIVASTTGFSSNMIGTVCDSTDTTGKCTVWEHMLITSVTNANTLQVTRGIAGTSARAHVVGLNFSALIDAAHQTAAKAAVIAIETALGAGATGPQGSGSHVQRAGTNSGVNGAALCNDASGSATTAGCTPPLPGASAQVNYLRTKPNSGNLTTYEFAGLAIQNTADYSFPAQTPGGSLIIGNNTITFTPVPLGMNGTDVGHKVYVSGGVGTAEACLITGGAGTSGASSGSIIINCANTHSGAWTVSSATGGIQECLQLVGANGSCRVPAGITHVQGVTNFTATGQSLLGLGRGSSIIQADYDSGDILIDGSCTANTCTGFWYVTIAHLGIQRIHGLTVLPTSGVTLGIYGAAYVRLDDLWLRHNYIAFDTIGNCTAGAALGNCSLTYADHIEIEGATNIAINGYFGTLSDLNYIGAGAGNGYSVTYTPVNEIKILFADGTTIRDVAMGGATSGAGILLAPPACTSCRVGLLNFVNIQYDSGTGVAPYVQFNGGTTTNLNGVNFIGCDFSTGSGTAPVFRFSNTTQNVRVQDSQFVNLSSQILDGTDPAPNVYAFIFQNNLMAAISNGLPLINLTSAFNTTSITNNVFNTAGGTAPTYAIQAAAGLHALTIRGNSFVDNVITAPFNIGTPGTGVSIGGNSVAFGYPSQTVASAASITLPVGYEYLALTGTTGVGTVLGLYEGRQLTLIPSGIVTFTAGATIGNTFTTAANVPVSCIVTGGKIYLK
jgi:hypothetical protein